MAAIAAVTFTLAALGGGVKHAIFTSVTGAMEIPQKLLDFTPPIAKNAFYYGAVTGVVRQLHQNLCMHLQKESGVKDYRTILAINTAVVAFEVLIRYTWAQRLSKMGVQIPSKYVVFSVVVGSPESLYRTKFLTEAIYSLNNPEAFKKKQKEWKQVKEYWQSPFFADFFVGRGFAN